MPVFSFTNAEFLKNEINTPHPDYLEKIIAGLRETYQLTPVEIMTYLEDKEGILERPITKDLKKLINDTLSE